MKRFTLAILLLALVVSSDTLAQTGKLYERTDGTWGYVVAEADDLGQWGIAHGKSQLWLELVESNSQLANADLIKPGDELTIPGSLLLLFRQEVLAQGGTVEPNNTPDPVNVPVQAEARLWNGLNTFLLVLLALAALAALYQAWRRRREREANPFAGPPVREGGLPTPEAAERHAAERYQTARMNMRVAAEATLPPTVSIVRRRAIEVRGPMLVQYAGGGPPDYRNLRNWTPAWDIGLSDGTSTITLQGCANDVYRGDRTTLQEGAETRDLSSSLPAEQIRVREDVPARTEPLQAVNYETLLV